MGLRIRRNAISVSAIPTAAFTVMQPDLGTSPVADSVADTLTFTSTDSSVLITGTAGTDTLDFILDTIDISDGTNLAVDAPVTLTNDTIGFDETFNFNVGREWDGIHEHNNDVIWENAGGEQFFYDRSEHSILYTLDGDGETGLLIQKNETVAPAAPRYLEVNINRTFTGFTGDVPIINVNLIDVGIDQTNAIAKTKLLNLNFNRDITSTPSVNNDIDGAKITLQYNAAHTNGSGLFMRGLAIEGASNLSANDAGGTTSVFHGIECLAYILPNNVGAGSAVGQNTFLKYTPSVLQFQNTINFIGFQFDPVALQIGGASNYTGIKIIPQLALSFGTAGTSIGYTYQPAGSAITNWTHIAWLASIGSSFNRMDSASGKSFWGAGDDVSISYSGMIWEFEIEQATTRIDFNPAAGDTDFRVSGDTDVDLFFTDAGNDRVGISTNVPDTLFHVAGAAHIDSDIQLGGTINHDGTLIGLNSAAPVAQDTGWSITNVSTLRSYDASTATLQNALDTLGTLIETVLKIRGDIGA